MLLYSGSCLLFEAFVSLWAMKNGEYFLPRILLIVSALSTAVVGVSSVGFIVCIVCKFFFVELRERPAVGYAYLWG